MKAIVIRKSDLRDHILEPKAKGLVLYCPRCVVEYSANRGDYWDCPADHEFKCAICGKPMQLGRFSHTFKRQLI